jgi:hypothetical protein
MKPEKLIGEYIENKISLIIFLVLIFFSVVFLLIIGGTGILASLGQSLKFVKSLWGLISVLGTLTLLLGILSAISAFFVALGVFIKIISDPRKWF